MNLPRQLAETVRPYANKKLAESVCTDHRTGIFVEKIVGAVTFCQRLGLQPNLCDCWQISPRVERFGEEVTDILKLRVELLANLLAEFTEERRLAAAALDGLIIDWTGEYDSPSQIPLTIGWGH